VRIYDSGEIAGGRYGLAMEFIDGVTLDKWSRSLNARTGRGVPRRNLHDRLRLMSKVCDAVLCAHQHAIVHRDLKPANILVDAESEPHVLDFGIAHQTGTDDPIRLTHTGEFAGTLAYASPEQVAGDPTKVDTRTDIYSLGVILYEMVTGHMPYDVGGPLALAVRNIESAVPVPPPTDPDVATIILKALDKDPARRYATAAGLRSDIDRFLAGEPIGAKRDQTWYVLLKGLRKHRRVVIAASALLLALLLGLAGLGYGLISSHESHLRESLERERTADAARRAQAVNIVLQELLPAQEGGAYPPDGSVVANGLRNLTRALDTGWLGSRPALASDVEEVLTDIYRARQTAWGWEAEMAARNSKLLNSGLYGPDNPRTLASAHKEAAAMAARGRLSDAERLARGNIEQRLKVLGPGHPAVIASRGLLAQILLALGRAGECQAECVNALRESPDDFGEGALEKAGVRRTYADALLITEGYDQAGQECVKALRVHSVEFRDINTDIAADLRTLADIFAKTPKDHPWSSPILAWIASDWPKAAAELRGMASSLDPAAPVSDRQPLIPVLSRLLELKSRLLPDEPTELAETHALLGRVQVYSFETGALTDRRLLTAAGAHFITAAHILENAIGPDHIAVANCYDDAADVLWDTDPSAAADASLSSVRIWRAQPPERQDQAQLATQERGVADTLTIAGRYAEAEIYYKIALKEYELLLGDDSYVVATTSTRYGEMLRRAGRLGEAERAALRGWTVGSKSLTAPPDQRMNYVLVLGSVLLDQGRFAEAEPLLFEALTYLAFTRDTPRHRVSERIAGEIALLRWRQGDLGGARWWLRFGKSGLFYIPRPG